MSVDGAVKPWLLGYPKILLICDIERGEERACVGAEATKEKKTMVPYLLRLLHPTALASLFATFGRVTYETIASYGTRFVVCDLRACHLRE